MSKTNDGGREGEEGRGVACSARRRGGGLQTNNHAVSPQWISVLKHCERVRTP
jgi:hypothetical protein